MRHMVFLAMAALFLCLPAFAQDPGIQDSVIVGSVHVDSGATFGNIQVFAVTDDSVGFYNSPLAWHAPLGGVHPAQGPLYFPPLTAWDLNFDTVLFDNSYIRMFGIYSISPDSVSPPPLLTNGIRRNIFTLRFIIAPNAPSQLVVIDTTYDPNGGSLLFGLVDGITGFTPAFQRGFISIGSVGIEPESPMPNELALDQNYPNPFNSSTNIGFTLAGRAEVTLKVYNLLGQHVVTLVDGEQEVGEHTITWNGKSQTGNDVPTGTYFYRLTTPDFSSAKRMVIIR